jgi:hypothetical protein
MINFFKRNQRSIIRNSFLLPIILVVIMSISHVVSWYDLGNPISWAIYLSVAIEIFALASVSAASIKASKVAIWFLFGLVTFIQIIGNVYFEFKEIDTTSQGFKDWMELVLPFFDEWSALDHRRLLAIVQGGTLPVMSLTALHFYIQFGQIETDPIVYEEKDNIEDSKEPVEEHEKSDLQKEADRVWETVARLKEEGVFPEATAEELADEPSALAFTPYLEEYEISESDDINSIKKDTKRSPGLSPKMRRILKK